jgi:hypothetical protein
MGKASKRASAKGLGKANGKHVVFLLDETGSMSICRGATITGFNEFIKKMKDEHGAGLGFSLTKFNLSKTDVVYKDEKISLVKPLDEKTYAPNDMTPLYDAIGKTVKETQEKLSSGKVIFVIMTDGEENSSKEYKRQDIFELISKKRADGWEFIFLGANQDSWQSGQSIGVSYTQNYDPQNMREAYVMTTNAVTSYLNTGSVNFGGGQGDIKTKKNIR